MSSVRQRVVALLGVSIVVVGVVVGGGAATAAPTKAPKPTSMSLFMSTSVTTSSHQKLGFFLDAGRTQEIGGTGTTFSVDLSRASENHQWSFPVPNSAFTFAHGKGKLKVPAVNLAPYGVVKLTLKPVGKPKRTTCSPKVYTISQKIHIAGTFYFDTRSTGAHKWGHFGNKHKKTSFKTAAGLSTSYGDQFSGCGSPGKPAPCANSLSWGAQSSDGSIGFNGGTEGKKGYISGRRYVTLAKPKNASRYDSVQATAPAPKLKKGAGGAATLSATTSGGAASGNAKLVSTTTFPPSSSPCGKKKSETDSEWLTGFTNGHPALQLHEQIFGALKLSNTATGSINSVKK